MKKLSLLIASLTLAGCLGTTPAGAGCKPDKIKLGMTEAQIMDVCSCSEPYDREQTLDDAGTTVKLTFYSEHIGVHSGMSLSGSNTYTPPPRTSSTSVIVTLKTDKVTAITQDTSWSGVSR